MSIDAPSQFEREILEQPDCLDRLLAQGRADVQRLAELVRRFDPSFVVTVARGSSDNAARYAKYVLGAKNRLVVSLGAPSLLTVYGRPPSFRRALVIGISQSGESHDLVALVAEARQQGGLTVALTNRPQSPLAAAAANVIPLRIGEERAVGASKSYLAQLAAVAMLSAALTDDANDWQALAGMPEAAARTLALNPKQQVAASAEDLACTNRMLVIGRGFNMATAFEVALKIKETAYLMADPYATPDLFHGPLAMAEPGLPALLIAPSGKSLPDVVRARQALLERGASVVTISDEDGDLADGAHPQWRLRLPTGVPEWLSPITAVIPGQLLSLVLAERRGLDPDRPRSLAKITRTL